MRIRCAAAFGTVVAATIAFGCPSAFGASGSWGLTRISVRPVSNATLSATSCPTASFCVAVGSTDLASGAEQAVIEVSHASGGWTDVTVPTPADSALRGVSCTSARFCVAVGDYYKYGLRFPLIETWRGSGWVMGADSIPIGNGAGLRAVSCVSASFCVAVGDRQVASDSRLTLIAAWDGTSWTMVGSADPAAYNTLRGVSCVSRTWCVAVGTQGNDETDPNDSGSLRERLTPQGWVLDGTEDDARSASVIQLAGLYGVSCTSTTFCLDVGYWSNFSSGTGTEVDRWDGSTWSAVDSSQFDRYLSAFDAVTCASTTFCTLAGHGTRWHLVNWNGTGLASMAAGVGTLDGVSCATDSSCAAVGSYGHAIAERYDGASWTAVSTYSGRGDAGSELAAVSCATARFCFATGDKVGPTANQLGLLERWNGRRWAEATAPEPTGSPRISFESVSCASVTFCVLGGTYATDTSDYNQFIEMWDGTSWSMAAVPAGTSIVDVSCPSATFCAAVGAGGTALSWDGSTWTTMPAFQQRNPGADLLMVGISCLSASDCTAVGTQLGAYPHFVDATIEHWNGTAWALVRSPRGPTLADNELNYVTCLSAAYCVAVGQTSARYDTSARIETWDGTQWRTTPVPAGATGNLTGVSCSAPGSCAAVGPDLALSSVSGTWSQDTLSAPPFFPNPPNLAAVSCDSGFAYCRAVGSYDGPGGTFALAEAGF